MELIYLKKSVHGKSAIATYKFVGGKILVYLRNNEACRTTWGDIYISAYIHPTNSANDIDAEQHSFRSYSKFREWRKQYEQSLTK